MRWAEQAARMGERSTQVGETKGGYHLEDINIDGDNIKMKAQEIQWGT
jgi:hypothetical protein